MKIAVDCRMIGMSGTGVYLENILFHLINVYSNEYLLIGNKEKLLKYSNFQNVKILVCDIQIFSMKELLFFPTREINKCDYFYSPNFNIPGNINIPIISTILDVIFLDINELTGIIGLIIRKSLIKRALRISHKIITISNFSKSRILHHFTLKKDIIIAPCGVNIELQKFKEQTNSPLNFSYIVFVGNIKKHKGIDLLIEAYIKARKIGLLHKLVIVGNYKSLKTKDIQTMEIINQHSENIVFAGKLSDNELYNYIYFARCLIQPSKYEGFGLPPLEALYLGCNTIVSNIPVFREIYEKLPVTFFDINNVDDLVEKLMTINNHKRDLFNAKNIINELYNFKISSEIILNSMKS